LIMPPFQDDNNQLAPEHLLAHKRELGDYTLGFFPMQSSTGIVTASLEHKLAKNTVVRQFDVVVQAGRAEETAVEQVAQVRTYAATGSNTMVIDFGMPRTVNAIRAPVTVERVSMWTGAAFAEKPFYTGKGNHAVFREVRTERLLVQLAAIPVEIGKTLVIALPEVPTDLAIAINGGPPVWTHPGPVQPGSGTVLSTTAWTADARRIVSLADALNALLSDPLSTEETTFEIRLTTKTPGVLDVKEHARSFSFINRIDFNGDTNKVLDFTEEGAIAVSLPVPGNGTRTVEEVRLTASGNLLPERVLPPVGPLPARTAEVPVLAELVLDPQRAACVRLSDSSGLAEVAAVRLPLATNADGAEVAVVLWTTSSTGEPDAPLPNGASAPVALTATPGPNDVWTRFVFPKPLALEQGTALWAAVLVSRGTVTWALASSNPGKDSLVEANVLRRGAPQGPWHALPEVLFQPAFRFRGVAVGRLGALGRVRMIGTAPKTASMAPLVIGAVGPPLNVTPTAKGVRVPMQGTTAFPPPLLAAGVSLAVDVVSRTAGEVTLQDVDVVWKPG
jgi:hypothetical protein